LGEVFGGAAWGERGWNNWTVTNEQWSGKGKAENEHKMSRSAKAFNMQV